MSRSGYCDDEYYDAVAKAFGVSAALAREIMYFNDKGTHETEWQEVEICGPVTLGWPDYGKHKRGMNVPVENAAEKRWQYMRDWVASKIVEAQP